MAATSERFVSAAEIAERLRAAGITVDIVGDPSIVVHGLTHDSRAVEPGQMFACLRGHSFDGHDYAAQTRLTDLAHTSSLKDLFFVSSRILDVDEEEQYHQLMHDRPDVFVQQIDRARNLYDTILIDCPPHLGAPTRAAISASDSIRRCSACT